MGSSVDCAIGEGQHPREMEGRSLAAWWVCCGVGGGKAEPAKTEALVGVGSGGVPMQLDLSL